MYVAQCYSASALGIVGALYCSDLQRESEVYELF